MSKNQQQIYQTLLAHRLANLPPLIRVNIKRFSKRLLRSNFGLAVLAYEASDTRLAGFTDYAKKIKKDCVDGSPLDIPEGLESELLQRFETAPSEVLAFFVNTSLIAVAHKKAVS